MVWHEQKIKLKPFYKWNQYNETNVEWTLKGLKISVLYIEYDLVHIFMAFVEGPIHKFQCQWINDFRSVWIMKENIMATNFEPNECLIFLQSTKIGTHENKQNYGIIWTRVVRRQQSSPKGNQI